MKVTLQPATLEDSRAIWEWNNAPEVRAASLSTDSISFEQHQRWIAERLVDPSTRIFLVANEGEPVGVVRFERRSAEDGKDVGLCSIALAAPARGRGIGREAIVEAGARFRREVPVADLEAWVVEGNASSLRAFRSAGYAPVGERQVADGRRFLILRSGGSVT